MPESTSGIMAEFFFMKGIEALKKIFIWVVGLIALLAILLLTGWFWVFADTLNNWLSDFYIVTDMILAAIIFVWFLLFYRFAKRFKARFSQQEENVLAMFNDLNSRLKRVEKNVWKKEKAN